MSEEQKVDVLLIFREKKLRREKSANNFWNYNFIEITEVPLNLNFESFFNTRLSFSIDCKTGHDFLDKFQSASLWTYF